MLDLLIISDIRLYREGLTVALSSDDSFSHVYGAASSDEARQVFVSVEPNIVLVDLATDRALPTVAWMLEVSTELPVVALTVPNEEDAIVRCLEAGATGYITREGSFSDLKMTIKSTADGELRCSPRIARKLARRLRRQQVADVYENSLSPRETEVLRLIEKGMSNKQIARSLGIEVATVKNHVHRILEKLGVSRRGEAAALRYLLPPTVEFSKDAAKGST